MLDHAMSVRVVNEPSETVAVRIRFPIAELYRRPHQVEAFGFKKFSCSQARIPLSQILDGKIETAVRCGVQGWRDPLLVLQFPFHQTITSGAIRHDVGFADDARRVHSQRLEHALPQKVSIELSADFVNQNAEQDITEVAVTPLFTRLERQRNRLRALE